MKYTKLGKTGLKVSRICVGCMSYGDRRWAPWVIEEAEALPILQKCYQSGINFFDTADIYSDGVSEEILGKAIKQFGWVREHIVIATKLNAPIRRSLDEKPVNEMPIDERDNKFYSNQYGLSRKHIFQAVEHSLKRLGVDYIDLYQIHRFDPDTPVEETMRALHDLVISGKVRYIGASSMRAHQFLEMQYTAKLNGWTQFVSMQNYYSAIYREEEREMMPSLEKFGTGCIPWSPLAMGYLARPASEAADSSRSQVIQAYMGTHDADKLINAKVHEIAQARGVTMAQVATAWVLSKPFITSPIIGMSSEKRVDDAIAALGLELTDAEIKAIDELYKPKEIWGHP
ncbi:hypothetical protein PYCC9005_003950 [Savitreella phatthalungensis]